MDLVTLFAIMVFSASWYFYARTDPSEPVVRLFLAALMVVAALVGVLGWVFRLVT